MSLWKISIEASAVLLQLNGKVICEHSVPSDPIIPPCKFSRNDRTQTSNGKINRGSMCLLRSHQRLGGCGGCIEDQCHCGNMVTHSFFFFIIYLLFTRKRWQRAPSTALEQPLWRRYCVHGGRAEVYCGNMCNRLKRGWVWRLIACVSFWVVFSKLKLVRMGNGQILEILY